MEASNEAEEAIKQKAAKEGSESPMGVSPMGSGSPSRKKPVVMRNSRVGVETLSIQDFKENLGSFEEVFEDEQGKEAS